MRLPPLNALRAFDAVVRLGSIRRAAAELNTSPSTVSTHVKNLEYFLGKSLFTRQSNALVLTECGQRYSIGINTGFETIIQATTDAKQKNSKQPLRVTCVPSLANSWFANQLTSFQEKFPHVTCECDFSPRPRQLYQEGFDLGIRYGSGQYLDEHSEHLFTDKVAPVCSPETGLKIRVLDDLLTLDRIECVESANDTSSQWDYWARQNPSVGEAGASPESRVTFVNSAAFAVRILTETVSVAIMDFSSVSGELSSGSLVCPLGGWLDAQYSYYVVYPKRKPLSSGAKLFKSALKRNVNSIAELPS